jgi:hypothetical protein
VLHEFEAGVANVSRHRRRVSVVRWADLAAVTEDMFQDEVARAEQVLAARPSRLAH